MQVSSISAYSIYSTAYSQAQKRIDDANADANNVAQIKGQQASEIVTSEALNSDKANGSQKKSSQSTSSVTYSELMHKLNLTPTGDYTKDYNTTVSRLNELLKFTTDPTKLQEYLQLADRISIAFAQPGSSSGSKTSLMSGSEQIAQLNRVMMLNMAVNN